MNSIRSAALRAVSWNYIGLIVRSGSNFLIGIFLARLLGPKPFGEVAAAALVVGMASLISDAGFTSALIQAPTITPRQISHVFTIQFVIALMMTSSCVAVSGPVAHAFHDDAIRGVLCALSPIFILDAFGQTAGALLRRELNFRTLQLAQITSYLCSYLAIGVPLALHGAGVWSLVAAQLSQVTIYAVMLYLAVRHSVLPVYDRASSHLLRFGAKVTVSNIVNYGISNADNFFVGRAFGSTSLGFYNRAFTLANAPADGIMNALQGVLFASCSRAEGRLDSLRRAYLTCISAVAFLVFPAFWSVALSAHTVVVGLYGQKWLACVPLFPPLAIALSLQVVMAMAGPILTSLDLVTREIVVQAFCLSITIPLFWVTSHHSVVSVAWAVCAAYLVRFIAMTAATTTALKLSWRDVVHALKGPAALGIFVASVVASTDRLTHSLMLNSVMCIGVLFTVGLFTLVLTIAAAGRYLIPWELANYVKSTIPRLSFILPADNARSPHKFV